MFALAQWPARISAQESSLFFPRSMAVKEKHSDVASVCIFSPLVGSFHTFACYVLIVDRASACFLSGQQKHGSFQDDSLWQSNIFFISVRRS